MPFAKFQCLLPLSNVCAAVNNAETFKEFLSERTKLVNTTLNSKVKQNASRITGNNNYTHWSKVRNKISILFGITI